MKKQGKFMLSIEEPCSENWNGMLQRDNGKFCNKCSKVVTDFTAMTDDEIIAFLQKSKGEVCGRVRMRQDQMEKVYEYQFAYSKSGGFNNAAFRYAIAGILTFASLKGIAQSGSNTPVTIVPKDNSGKIHGTKINLDGGKKPAVINVRAVDRFTGKQLTSSTIYVRETGKSYSPVSGSQFSIEIPDSLRGKSVTLEVSANSHGSETIVINAAEQGSKVYEVKLMNYENMKMGKMIYKPIVDTASQKKCK